MSAARGQAILRIASGGPLMRSPSRLVISVVCLGLVAGAPVARAQAIPKVLIRLCLRNIATGIACYVIGRGGELIVDGSLSAAWAKAKETVTGEEPKDHDTKKAEGPQQLRDLTKPSRPGAGKPPSLFANQVIEPISPSDLGSLAKRLPGSRADKTLTEGFLIYEVPTAAPKPLGPKSVTGTQQPKSLLPIPPEPSRSDRGRTKSLLSEPVIPKSSLTAGQLGTLRSECQKRKERESGLSLLAVFGAPDFDAKFKRRMEEVVKPCMGLRPF